MRAAPPPLSVSIQGRGRPPPPPSAVRAHASLISALLHQQVEPPLQLLAVNPPRIPHILAFTLQRDVPPLRPLSACSPPPLLSVSLQGQGEPPLLPSTVRVYVYLLSALLLQKGAPLCQPSAEPDPLTHISALPLQQVIPPLHPLAVCAPPHLYVSLQGLCVPPLLPSAVRAYAPLLW